MDGGVENVQISTPLNKTIAKENLKNPFTHKFCIKNVIYSFKIPCLDCLNDPLFNFYHFLPALSFIQRHYAYSKQLRANFTLVYLSTVLIVFVLTLLNA